MSSGMTKYNCSHLSQLCKKQCVAILVITLLFLLFMFLSLHHYTIPNIYEGFEETSDPLLLDYKNTTTATENQTEHELASTLLGYNATELKQHVETGRNKSDALQTNNATIKYHGRDLMKYPPIKFNPNFKNPCWFEDKELRCLPYMFLIGVKKCATGELFTRITMHPDFVYAGFKELDVVKKKIIHVDDRTSHSSITAIYDFITKRHRQCKNILSSQTGKAAFNQPSLENIQGEGSPSNLHLNTHWKYLPGNENMDEPKYVILDYIRHLLPNAKIIILFRDPIERLYSDYYHEYGAVMRKKMHHVRPTKQHFHKVVTKGLQAYKKCFQNHSIKSCVYNSVISTKTLIQIQLGIYYIYWQELLRTFPRQQLLVLHKNGTRDEANTLKSVFTFLDLRELTDEEMANVVRADARRQPSYPKDGPMMNITLKLLQEFYAPFNQRMADITGDSQFLYGYE